MGFISNLEKAARKNYGDIQNKLSFLPKSPTKILGKRQVMGIRRKGVLEQFTDPDILKILKFNNDNYEMLHSDKDGLMLGHYLEFLKQTDHVDGDILELGTYKGVTTILFAKLLDLIKSDKKIYTCDVFTGLPYEDKHSTAKNTVGNFGDTSYEFVNSQFDKFNVSQRITVIKGLFEDTLYKTLDKNKFSFVLLDCDIYDSTKFCLPFIDDRLNGIVAFDDYEQDPNKKPRWGMTRAVNEFYQKINLEPVPHLMK